MTFADLNNLKPDLEFNTKNICQSDVIPRQIRRKRVMIVDDNHILRNMLEDIMIMFGYEAVTCSNGIEALEQIEKKTFDIVITDLEMPYMDGLKLSREVKARSKDIPVVLLTGASLNENSQELYAASIDHILYKPVGLNEIQNTLHFFLYP